MKYYNKNDELPTGYYIYEQPYKYPHGSGVISKIQMQVNEFSKYYSVLLLVLAEQKLGISGQIIKRLPFFSVKRNYSYVLKHINTPCYIYIRKSYLDRKYMWFLKEIRKNYPQCKILMEIPTYPYDKQMSAQFFFLPRLWKDQFYRNKLKHIIDRIVTFSDDDKIFGVPCIKVMNGIDVKSIKVVSAKYEADDINMIFVGHLQKWHGLERIIYGLKEYYSTNPSTNVSIHCVGEGDELNFYKRLVKQEQLEKQFIFYGLKQGEELNEIYEKANIAIAPLAAYKKDIKLSSALKVREYLAKGLPIITGCTEDVIETYPCDFCLNFANDSSIIKIDTIIQWYKDLIIKYGTFKDLTANIRKYATEHIDNNFTMKPILDYIRQGN